MKRIQFEVNDEQIKILDSIMKKTGVTTKKDLFNNAITLTEWVVEQVANKRLVGSISQDGESYRELNMPILSHVKSHCKKSENEQ